MGQVNVSLPNELKTFVDQHVAARGFGLTSEYLRDLIRKQRDVEPLPQLLLEGASSPVKGNLNKAFFQGLRKQVRARARK